MKILYYFMFLTFPSLYGHSQIPLTDIVKKKIERVDSVNEFRKYIGEKILLPPFRNIDLRKNSQLYTIRFYKPSVISENSRPTISSIYYPYNFIITNLGSMEIVLI